MLPTDASPDQIITAIQENLNAHMLFFPERLKSFTVLKAQELIIINSHLAERQFNQVFRARLHEDTALQVIESAVNYFQREKAPFTWYIGPDDTPTHLKQLLEQKGLKKQTDYQGAACTIADRIYEQTTLRVERVIHPMQLTDYASVMFDVYGDNPAMKTYYQQLTMFPFADNDYEQLYIGYLDEMPVSCGILTLHSGVVGVSGLSTIRSHTKKEYAIAMMQELLMRAQMAGYNLAVANFSQEIAGLYKHFGFEARSDFFVYEMP